MLTAFGAAAVTFMVVMYALERRNPRYTLGFAVGCLLSSAYGFLAGAWPFGVVEVVWAGVALNRWRASAAISVDPPVTSRDQAVEARGRELVDLASRHFPQEFEVAGDPTAFPLIGTALVSRMTGTMKSILALQPEGREADAGTLLRSLFEHAVHLGWLAADSSAERIQEWKKDDLVSRLKADADLRERGEPILTDEERAAMERQVAGLYGSGLAPLTNLAVAADKRWEGTLPGMGAHGELKSFRGFYALLYRSNSGFAHPTFRGMNVVAAEVAPGRQRAWLEERHEGTGPYGMATLVFGFGLYLASAALDWPVAAEISAIFDRHPG
jgi:hypothetical protein